MASGLNWVDRAMLLSWSSPSWPNSSRFFHDQRSTNPQVIEFGRNLDEQGYVKQAAPPT